MQITKRGTGCALALLAALCLPCARAEAAGQRTEGYQALKQRISEDGRKLRRSFAASPGARLRRYTALEAELLGRIDKLFASWIGSRWGLGLPQSTVPNKGKTNCGLFVAVVLRDAGFRLPIWKFNRQVAYHGIKSLAPRSKIRYLHRTSMKTFTDRVRAMGPGLYLIGLDFHIGFLRVKPSGDVRFVHGSYITRRVMDEPAQSAIPIVQSRYRMVGKILQPTMLRSWLKRRPIKVLGNR
jgi:hypothetical protein